MLDRLRATVTESAVRERLKPREDALPPRLRLIRHAKAETIERLWQRLASTGVEAEREEIADAQTIRQAATYSGNIENFIGTVKVPVGVIGPVRINGLHANGDFFIPLAATEAALVASYGRGACPRAPLATVHRRRNPGAGSRAEPAPE